MKRDKKIILKYLVLSFFLKYFVTIYKKINKKYSYTKYLNSILIKSAHILVNRIRKENSKIFLINGRDFVNWSIDKDRKNAEYFLKLNQVILSNKIIGITHVFCVWYDTLFINQYYWIKVLKNLLDYKIIAVITNDIKNQSNILKLKLLKDQVDLWIAPSQRIYKFLQSKNFLVELIPFYVDKKEFFYINKDKKQICDDLNINYEKVKGKVLFGTFQRDSTKDLIHPKEVKNPDLLIEILKYMPKEKVILLIAGPRRHYLVNECLKNDIPFVYYGDYSCVKESRDDLFINNHDSEVINKLYNLTDVYIVTSRIEGGPKAIIEASLTRTLIFSTKVGLAADFLHPDLIFSEHEIRNLINFLRNFKSNQDKISNYIDFNYKNARKKVSERNYCQLYKKMLNNIC